MAQVMEAGRTGVHDDLTVMHIPCIGNSKGLSQCTFPKHDDVYSYDTRVRIFLTTHQC